MQVIQIHPSAPLPLTSNFMKQGKPIKMRQISCTNLWCHPIRCAHMGFPVGQVTIQMTGHTCYIKHTAKCIQVHQFFFNSAYEENVPYYKTKPLLNYDKYKSDQNKIKIKKKKCCPSDFAFKMPCHKLKILWTVLNVSNIFSLTLSTI